MGFRQRLLNMLDGGDAGLDSEQFVEFVVVRLSEGPMLLERLRQAEIEARGRETISLTTGMLTDYSVSVRRRDLAAATSAWSG